MPYGQIVCTPTVSDSISARAESAQPKTTAINAPRIKRAFQDAARLSSESKFKLFVSFVSIL
jgi:hypothetical protein